MLEDERRYKEVVTKISDMVPQLSKLLSEWVKLRREAEVLRIKLEKNAKQ